MELEGKTVLVTGATSGIGRAIAELALARGAQVVAVGRNPARLAELSALGAGRVTPVEFDLTRFEEHPSLVAKLPEVHGVVHSAGIVDNNPVRFFSLKKYNDVIAINQTAPLVLVAELARAGKLAAGASVVFLSSISGTVVGIKGVAAYAASKGALLGMTRVLALELSHRMVRVNCVSPGMVQTEMVEGLSQLTDEAIKADLARYPLGKRYAQPQEVAETVAFLLSERSRFVTGQNLVVDGGYCAQ